MEFFLTQLTFQFHINIFDGHNLWPLDNPNPHPVEGKTTSNPIRIRKIPDIRPGLEFKIRILYTTEVYLPVAPDEVLTYGKNKFALKYSNGKAMPNGFSHFYCHRVVLSTQKNFKSCFNINGRLVAARWSPTAKNIVSDPLVQHQRPARNPDHQRAVPSLLQWLFIHGHHLAVTIYIHVAPSTRRHSLILAAPLVHI